MNILLKRHVMMGRFCRSLNVGRITEYLFFLVGAIATMWHKEGKGVSRRGVEKGQVFKFRVAKGRERGRVSFASRGYEPFERRCVSRSGAEGLSIVRA